MKAYKEKKANEPEPADASSPEAAKTSKKSSVKELFAKKADKKKGGSPRKSAGSEAQKFKSAEFVDTDDSSSEDEGKKAKPKSKPKGKEKQTRQRAKTRRSQTTSLWKNLKRKTLISVQAQILIEADNTQRTCI
ncbi:hypothetical protein OS493_040100 [Desmophyllum pertusum]|uniref:Uncharacterized protein n=1 Tax=Desmophyllum pertusum TaxID=174260 RepID=A0A9W9YTW1_9CNID|nr:hypothetical protein OS493_040100 [Desmophyllum pertusum]